MKIVGIILMAGQGMRFGHALPKQFHRLSGKAVYEQTLEVFENAKVFDDIILVCHPDFIDTVQKTHSHIQVISGGVDRQASSLAGIQAASRADIVLIHDGARPFVNKRILWDNIEAAKKYGAVNTCIPSNDTIVHAQDGLSIDTIPKRSEYWRGQTPQSFKRDLILKAHELSSLSNATDDCQLVHNMGHSVHIVMGDERNIKITSELDLFLAEQLMRKSHDVTLKTVTSIYGKQFAIVGGNSDIGIEICKQLKEAGAKAISIGRGGSDFTADGSSYTQIKSAFNAIEKLHGPIDGVVNCIGKLMIKGVRELSERDMSELIDSNLMSAIYSCKAAHVKKGGSLINIASSSYFRGRANYALYSSAKAALVNFTQALAEEWPEMQINALVPTRVNTKMRKSCFPDEDTKLLLTPKKVAESVISLLKDNQLTGSVIEVRP